MPSNEEWHRILGAHLSEDEVAEFAATLRAFLDQYLDEYFRDEFPDEGV